jgi:gas vesicle protein
MKETTIRIIITIISAIADILLSSRSGKENRKEVKSNDQFRSAQAEREIPES